MKNFTLKSILVALALTSACAEAQTINDFSVLPEGLVVTPDNTADVLIILDNSMSMANSVNQTGVVGGHHPLSRSAEARSAIRDVLTDISDSGSGNAISVGVMEFDIEFIQRNGNGNNIAVNTCGDAFPPRSTELADVLAHEPTPLLENCATANNNGDFQLDAFGRIIADNPDTTFTRALLPQATGIGRLRAGIEPLTAEHLERINNVLAPEPLMPELRCNATNSQSEVINGVRQCSINPNTNEPGNNNDDYQADNFPNGVTPSLANEGQRLLTESYRRMNSLGYAFTNRLFNNLDANGVPAIYNEPTASSLPTRGTPTYGALVSAHNYLRGISSNNIVQLLQDDDDGATPMASSVDITDASNSNMCTTTTFILLITDGEPFSLLDGTDIAASPAEACSNPLINDLPAEEQNCSATGSSILRHSRNSIEPLVTAMRLGYTVDVNGNGDANVINTNRNSIETFVFGFAGLNNQGLDIVDFLANAGSVLEDGTPRTPFLSENGDQLREDLAEAFGDIIPTISSNSGVAINASPSSGGGAIVSSSFNPRASSADGTQTVSWVGEVVSYFIDEFGFLREDANSNNVLDDYDVDPAFTLTFNVNLEETEAQRLNVNGATIGTAAFDPETDISDDGNPVSPSDIASIWEASEVFNSYVQSVGGGPNIFGTIQRAYAVPANPAAGYRRIYTSLPDVTDPDDITQIDFVPTLVTADNFGLFAVDTEEEAQNVVRFIRGEEGIAGFRSRTIDNQQFLLGDIVHSTASVVDIPAADFGSRFGDASYIEFQEAYQFRRRMVYVGGNDGMLHAFNAGFFDAQDTAFELTAGAIGCTANCDNAAHELGAELWSYVPQNLLPHLQFLSDSEYSSNVHIAYVDGPVQTFDVQIFDDDAVHVNGWGTIAVVGMRLGGGDFEVDPNNDGDTSDSITTRSAFTIIDVTDPSQEPVVLAEITDLELGFSTTNTQVLRDGDEWFLAFGSGPNDLIDFVSVGDAPNSPRNPIFYKYRLDQDVVVTNRLEKVQFTPSIGGSGFIGNLTSQDWNSDTFDDAVYFGVVTGSAESPSGGMYRFVNDPNSSQEGNIRPLLITEQPVASAPIAVTNSGLDWVLFGTGRYLSNADLENGTQSSFFSIKEPREDYPDQDINDVINVTNIDVEVDTGTTADGEIVILPESETISPELTLTGDDGSSETITTSAGLSEFIIANGDIAGWRIDYAINPLPSDRTTAAPVTISDQVLFATFSPNMPSEDECVPVFGQSFLNVANITNGLPNVIASLGIEVEGNTNAILDSIQISDSAITSLNVVNTLNVQTNEVDPSVVLSDQNSGITNQAIGASTVAPGRRSWIELDGL